MSWVSEVLYASLRPSRHIWRVHNSCWCSSLRVNVQAAEVMSGVLDVMFEMLRSRPSLRVIIQFSDVTSGLDENVSNLPGSCSSLWGHIAVLMSELQRSGPSYYIEAMSESLRSRPCCSGSIELLTSYPNSGGKNPWRTLLCLDARSHTHWKLFWLRTSAYYWKVKPWVGSLLLIIRALLALTTLLLGPAPALLSSTYHQIISSSGLVTVFIRCRFPPDPAQSRSAARHRWRERSQRWRDEQSGVCFHDSCLHLALKPAPPPPPLPTWHLMWWESEGFLRIFGI